RLDSVLTLKTLESTVRSPEMTAEPVTERSLEALMVSESMVAGLRMVMPELVEVEGGEKMVGTEIKRVSTEEPRERRRESREDWRSVNRCSRFNSKERRGPSFAPPSRYGGQGKRTRLLG
ncbi:MAG: hypothetical protein G01um101444_450, partial [Parcubacteria group bacterium Gr01-1014_44]